jgi:hypothetical protein
MIDQCPKCGVWRDHSAILAGRKPAHVCHNAAPTLEPAEGMVSLIQDILKEKHNRLTGKGMKIRLWWDAQTGCPEGWCWEMMDPSGACIESGQEDGWDESERELVEILLMERFPEAKMV